MKLWVYGSTLLFGLAMLWLMSGTQRERPLVGAAPLGSLAPLEFRATAHLDDPGATERLAQAYLDAREPGLAVVLLEGAPDSLRGDVRIEHIYARALLEEGRNEDALAVERRVVSCHAAVGIEAPAAGCSDVIRASAGRRVAILEEMVASGVHDVQAYPEASFAAYRNATRDARIGLR